MKRYKIYFALALLVAFGELGYVFYTMPPPLVLDTRVGPAPLVVHITGPQDIVNRANDISNPWVGCGFRVSWGDGQTREPGTFSQPCTSMLTHVYQSKGVYTITASLGGFDSEDGLSNEAWRGTATVEVK